MKYLSNARKILVTLAIAGVAIRVLWWSIAPLLPLIVMAIILITIIGIAIFRTTRL